jgi:type II secretory pathway pseudopilin PulG
MVKNARLLLSVILLAAAPVSGWAQDAKAILSATARAMGAVNLRTIQYSAAGSIYDEKGQHIVVSSYSGQMDLNAMTSSIRMVQMQGTPPTPQTVNQTIAADSPWNVQFDFWLTPYGFLKGAMANDATAETKTVEGETYKVVTFTLPGNHKIAGYINNKDLVERVEARTDNDVLVQAFYHDYEDFGGLKIPTVIVSRRNGDLALVLIVKEAKPNV